MALTCSFFMYLFRFQTEPSCYREVGELMASMYMVSNEVEGGGHDTWSFYSFVGQFVNFFIAKYVCVCPNFVNGNIMGGGFYCIYGASNILEIVSPW